MLKPNSIDEYIAAFPKETQVILETLRVCIQKAAPEAVEKISYAIPTFYLHGNLIHFAAYKNHIGVYPLPSKSFPDYHKLEKYIHGKGTLRFPINEPIPLALITKMVKWQIKREYL